MGAYVASQLVKAMTKRQMRLENARVLIMGFTFKENCPDFRNTRVIDIVDELREFNCKVDVYDPWIDKAEIFNEHKFSTIDVLIHDTYDAIVLAVAHDSFKELGILEIRALGKSTNIIYDLKYLFNESDSDLRL